MKTWHHCKSAKKDGHPVTIRACREEIEWLVSGLWECARSLKIVLTAETKRDMPRAYAEDEKSLTELKKMIDQLNNSIHRK